MTTHRVHHGHNIKRLREIQGVKQQSLALELGAGWNQKKVSVLESRSTISPELLEQVAKILGLSAEAIENFQESALCKQLTGMPGPSSTNTHHSVLELVEKFLELLEENRTLYHCLLQAEKKRASCWNECWRREAVSYKLPATNFHCHTCLTPQLLNLYLRYGQYFRSCRTVQGYYQPGHPRFSVLNSNR